MGPTGIVVILLVLAVVAAVGTWCVRLWQKGRKRLVLGIVLFAPGLLLAGMLFAVYFTVSTIDLSGLEDF